MAALDGPQARRVRMNVEGNGKLGVLALADVDLAALQPVLEISAYGLEVLDGRTDEHGEPGQHGLLIQVEPGLGGGKVGLGYAKGLLNVGGAGMKAFYMRTWGPTLWAQKNRGYVGVEADATLFMKLSVGVMRTVGEGPRDTAFTGGIGIGF